MFKFLSLSGFLFFLSLWGFFFNKKTLNSTINCCWAYVVIGKFKSFYFFGFFGGFFGPITGFIYFNCSRIRVGCWSSDPFSILQTKRNYLYQFYKRFERLIVQYNQISMCKQKSTKIKLFIPAGGATTTPPFGPILGQYGINTVQFCKDFNEVTGGLTLFFHDSIADSAQGFILVVDIYINEDRTYKYILNKPPTSFLLRLLSGVKLGAPRTVAGNLPVSELVLMAQFKFPDANLRSACQMLLGTARSIGVRITN